MIIKPSGQETFHRLWNHVYNNSTLVPLFQLLSSIPSHCIRFKIHVDIIFLPAAM